tara:strand:+ start:5317 stop:5529 length:213 start_codon:yes stop_codon:yes gene_type:complete
MKLGVPITKVGLKWTINLGLVLRHAVSPVTRLIMKRGEVRRLAMMPDIQKLVEWKTACWDTTKRSWNGKR